MAATATPLDTALYTATPPPARASNGSSKRVGVIGSGLAGLTAACTLAARGHQVTVFEKNEWLGGKAAQLNAQGFRFDMGPTILIQPSMLRKVFAEAGRRMEDYVPMVRLDPQWRCFFEDKSVLDLKDDTQAMAADLERLWPKMGAGYLKLMEQSRIFMRSPTSSSSGSL